MAHLLTARDAIAATHIDMGVCIAGFSAVVVEYIKLPAPLRIVGDTQNSTILHGKYRTT